MVVKTLLLNTAISSPVGVVVVGAGVVVVGVVIAGVVVVGVVVVGVVVVVVGVVVMNGGVGVTVGVVVTVTVEVVVEVTVSAGVAVGVVIVVLVTVWVIAGAAQAVSNRIPTTKTDNISRFIFLTHSLSLGKQKVTNYTFIKRTSAL